MPSAGKRRAAASVEKVDGADAPRLGFIPSDPADHRLTVDGAILGKDGKLDVDAYAELFGDFANEPEPENHPFPDKPGVRSTEFVPKGLSTWDDVFAGHTEKDGAGWIARRCSAKTGKKEKWFNIRTCGSWRMAFLLARLQREVWEQRGDKATTKPGALGEQEDDGNTDDPNATEKVAKPAQTPKRKTPASTATPRPKRAKATETPEKREKAQMSTSASVQADANEAIEPSATSSPTAPAPAPPPPMNSKMQAMLERIRAREAAAKTNSSDS